MSDTPRHDETPEFRDPTAPIETDQTQEVPPMPPAPSVPPTAATPPAAAPAPPSATPPTPPGAPTGQPGYGPPPAGAGAPPPPPNPYASAPGTAPQNPYGGQQLPAHGQAQGGYGGAPAYGTQGYGTPMYAAPRSLPGNTIALLIVSGLTTLACGFGIVGLVFAIIAAAKKDDVPACAKFTRWGWIAVVVGLVLSIIAIVAFFALVVANSTSTSFNTSY